MSIRFFKSVKHVTRLWVLSLKKKTSDIMKLTYNRRDRVKEYANKYIICIQFSSFLEVTGILIGRRKFGHRDVGTQEEVYVKATAETEVIHL